jgi:hypothetical protein
MTTLHCSFSQALRLSMYPYFRPVDMPSTVVSSKDVKVKGNNATPKKARSPSPKSKQRHVPAATDGNSSKKDTKPALIEKDSNLTVSLSESVNERQRPALQLQQLNTVIFGLPNLTFTP